MDFIKVILTSLLSIVTLFILTKLMGNRQMSQLSMFDYINGITIGSIAAELATDLEGDFWQPVVAMAVYAVVTVCITFITTKSIGARRLLTGRSVILFENGKFRTKDMLRAQVDTSEFMTQCRISGCFSLSGAEGFFDLSGEGVDKPDRDTRRRDAVREPEGGGLRRALAEGRARQTFP